MTQIAANITHIRQRMMRACIRAHRSVEDVRLMVVSKYVETPRIAEAIECGITLFGENRAQELKEKKTFFEDNRCTVHFIGQLQTNKIKYVCGNADTVESVDRMTLADGLSARALTLACVQDIMIQVNIGEEAAKGGISDVDLICFVQHVTSCGNLRITGLMCVPPALKPEAVRPYFSRMRIIRDMLKKQFPDHPIHELSMGMSHDYEVAIEEGATIVRIGTGVFGARYPGVAHEVQ